MWDNLFLVMYFNEVLRGCSDILMVEEKQAAEISPGHTPLVCRGGSSVHVRILYHWVCIALRNNYFQEPFTGTLLMLDLTINMRLRPKISVVFERTGLSSGT